jgi:hypothetical protein
MSFSDINEFLTKIEPILLVVIPALLGVWYKITSVLRKRSELLRRQELIKAKSTFDRWAHHESRFVVLKMAELCNMYRDRGEADQVLFLQFENGTTSTSQLYTMYLSCLAEDNRYGTIPNKCASLQRIPYANLVDWVEECTEAEDCIALPHVFEDRPLWAQNPLFLEVGSNLSQAVYDREGYIIGLVVFNYASRQFNGTDREKEIDLIHHFKTAVETVFLSYQLVRHRKMVDLGLTAP